MIMKFSVYFLEKIFSFRKENVNFTPVIISRFNIAHKIYQYRHYLGVKFCKNRFICVDVTEAQTNLLLILYLS